MISEFKNKKLVEYLEDGMKVLVLYHCGWGDLITFMVAYNKLKELYPKVEFTLYLENDQDKIFPSVNKIEEDKYDLVFSPNFPMGEGSGVTKVENCCIKELGIPSINGVIELPKKRSPIVLVHFQGTALPNSVNCSSEIAEKIWNEIKESGFVPIETHWLHGFHNPVNKKYDFINRDVRDCQANLSNLIGLVQHSFAFVGICSGPMMTALSVIPKHTFVLEKLHKLTDYVKEDFIKENNIKHININDYKPNDVKLWLENIQ
jgi:hypothetical protein